MKRVVLILSCLSIFYAGAVWALEGCREFGDGHELFHDGEGALSEQHHRAAEPHSSHSDPARVHCPNVFAEFLLSSRASLASDRGSVPYAALCPASDREFRSAAIFFSCGEGPPGLSHNGARSLHLLLSVIRI